MNTHTHIHILTIALQTVRLSSLNVMFTLFKNDYSSRLPVPGGVKMVEK